MKNNKKIPLIKEYHIDKIKSCLKCIDRHPFDRNKQKEYILSLYPNKKDKAPEHKEKSVFRGMVIPSLRGLGLIIGYGDYIRLSANGKFILESESMGEELHQRALRAVTFEIDKNKFQFVDILQKTPISIQTLLDCLDINAPSKKQKKERVKKWCSILEQSGLIINTNKGLLVDYPKYKQTLLDMDIQQKDMEIFKKHLFNAYSEIGKETGGIVDIADLREEVAVKMLRNNEAILTESQFDEMLRETPFATDDYIVSLGRPMGAEEKLFKYKGEYFRTLSIKRLKRE